ncbi:MAG: hypothetical protein U1F43_29980 [Myxococcota bacterium]
MKAPLILIGAWILVAHGCSDDRVGARDTSTSPSDTSPSDSSTSDTSTSPSDTSTSDTSTSTSTSDSSTSTSDTGTSTTDTSTTDTTASPDIVDDRPQGQCVSASDCPGFLLCSEAVPGGFCNGCNGEEPCPDGYDCNFGGCNLPCDPDDPRGCPAGLRCHPTAFACVQESCSGTEDCEAPYVCDGGFCHRPACDGTACPAPLHCVAGTCVEAYFPP